MEVRVADCPLGAKCEEVKTEADGRQVLYRCPWYKQLRGKNPQTGELADEWDCAIGWLPLLLIENTKEAIENTASINVLRNDLARSNQVPNLIGGLIDEVVRRSEPDRDTKVISHSPDAPSEH